jgi:hypothetical protein
MKAFTLIILLITLTITTFSQTGATGNIYEDAIRLYSSLSEGRTAENITGILSFYSGSNFTTVNAAASSTTVTTNRFFARLFTKYTENVSTLAAATYLPRPSSGMLAGLGGLNVTKYADGIAKFLLERGKQELSMAFFDRFKKDLNKFPELSFLFPTSVKILEEIKSHNAQSVLQELKDAFMKDLSIMPSSLLSLQTIQPGDCDPNDLKCISRVGAINSIFSPAAPVDPRLIVIPLVTSQGIIDGDNIIDVMNKLATNQLLCSNNDDLSSLIKIISIFFESLRNNDPSGETGIFVNQGQIQTLFSSPDLLDAFLGIVYLKYSNVENYSCYNGLILSTNNLENILQRISVQRNKFYSLLTSFDKVNLAYIAASTELEKEGNFGVIKISTAIFSSFSMISNFSEAISASLGLPISYNTTFARFFQNLEIAADFTSDIAQKNYTGIFNSCIRFIDKNSIITNPDAKSKVVKYLSFAANLSSATTSEEVKDAINSVALPSGSYSLKQKSSWNISLNGYVGYSWDFNSGIYARGVTAPVGFSISKGLSKNIGGAVTLFVSLIDVGAIVSYRLSNNSTDDLKQEIRLESIVSPSAQLLIAIPKLPIAVGGGWKLTPKLFFSKDNTFTTVPSTNVFSLSVLIDIPIFTFFNRSYN